jgi:hypothetical protein
MRHVTILLGAALAASSSMIACGGSDGPSTNTTITLTNSSTTLTYTANLHSAMPTGIAAGTAAITLDWATMTTNALGQPFVATSITSALIGHYSQDIAYLESHFLDLETLPTALYRGQIASGTVVDFSMLTTESGQAFTGIDDTGTWLIGLECGNCGIPAPWYLSVLKVCGSGGVTCASNPIIAKEANNYQFTSVLKLAPATVMAKAPDLTIKWGDVTKDFLGHPVNPLTDIDMVEVIVVNLPLAELEDKLNVEGTLPTAVLETVPPPALLTDGTATSAMLTSFQVNSYPVMSADIANYLDPTKFDPATTSYVAIAASGMELGKGSLMIQAFKVGQ